MLSKLMRFYEGDQPFIFFSYSSKNEELADEIIELLIEDNYRVFCFDSSKDFSETIRERVFKSSLFVVLLSKEYLASFSTLEVLNYAKKLNKDILVITILENENLGEALTNEINRISPLKVINYQNSRILESQLSEIEGTKNYLKVPEEIIKDYLPLANSGNEEAMYYLGVNYNKIDDFEKALAWYKKAAELGDNKSLYTLGVDYSKFDEEKALDYWKRAAQAGNVEALYKIGLYYFDKKEYASALPWLSKSTKYSDKGLFEIAYIYHKYLKDYDKAEELYLYLAQRNNFEAMVNLGVIYGDIKKDYDKAIYWLEKAGKKGIILGYHNLGNVYAKELENYEKAIEAYNNAIALGGVENYTRIAKLYEYNLKDYRNAVINYEKAIENNIEVSNNLFSLIRIYNNVFNNKEKTVFYIKKYLDRGYATKDQYNDLTQILGFDYVNKGEYEEAIKWLEVSANNNDLTSIKELAYLYATFYQDDEENILKWNLKAAELGDTTSLFNSGIYLYRRGEIDKALRYLKLAAEDGFFDALDVLKNHYYSSNKKQRKEGIEFFEKLANQGNADAMYELYYLYAKGFHLKKSTDWLLKAYEAGCKNISDDLLKRLDKIYK